jgi:hypothetical protein
MKNKAIQYFGMIRILGKHGNINRVEFGSALWNSVLRPTEAHGCPICSVFCVLNRDSSRKTTLFSLLSDIVENLKKKRDPLSI